MNGRESYQRTIEESIQFIRESYDHFQQKLNTLYEDFRAGKITKGQLEAKMEAVLKQIRLLDSEMGATKRDFEALILKWGREDGEI